MNKKVELSSGQIKELYDLVSNRGCPYLDLQSEIVDHIATTVEAKLEQYPYLTYDSAVQSTFRSMPATGFHNIIDEKEKALKSYWWRIIFKELLSYFTLPRIILTVVVILLSYTLLVVFGNYGMGLIGVILTIGTIIAYRRLGISTWRNDPIKDDFLFMKMLKSCVITLANPVGILLYMWFNFDLNFGVWVYIHSAIIGFSSIWIIMILTFIPSVLEREFQSKYAHLKVA